MIDRDWIRKFFDDKKNWKWKEYVSCLKLVQFFDNLFSALFNSISKLIL